MSTEIHTSLVYLGTTNRYTHLENAGRYGENGNVWVKMRPAVEEERD